MVRNLSGQRANTGVRLEVIRDFSYQFRPGSFYELAGLEVSGKNLLLHLLGLLWPPKSGDIFVDGSRANGLDLDDLSYLRNRKYGFLFSAPFLLPAFTVLENVAMPLFKIAEIQAREAKVITEEILEMMGVSRLADASVEDLNSLDGMLAALARALVHHPRVLIAENVGHNLRENEANILLSMLQESGRRLGLTVIATFASHVSWELADVCLEIRSREVKELKRRNPHG